MKSRKITAVVGAITILSGCVVAPVDGVYYSPPPATIGYYGSPAVSHVWIGGTWSSYHYRHGYPYWSPGYHHHWKGPGLSYQQGFYKWNQGGGHGWGHGGHWRGGGHWQHNR